MSRRKESESIRIAARHAAAASEILLQLSALHSFKEQGILHNEEVAAEAMVLVKEYVTEMDKASVLIKQYINGHTNGRSKSQTDH